MNSGRELRVPARYGVDGRARGGVAGNPTEGWRDKRPHVAARSVGCSHWSFRRFQHLAAFRRNVPESRKALILHDAPHIGKPRHAR